MSKLRIKRTDDWMNSSRKIRIYLDDKMIGTVSNNATKEFNIKSGRHKIRARIDWCGSKSLHFNINKNETKTIKTSGLKAPKYLFAALIIMLGSPTLLNIYLNTELNLIANLCLSLSGGIVFILFYILVIKRNSYLSISE